MSILFYDDKADSLAELYLSLSFDDVHGRWLELLAGLNTIDKIHILDVGAGSGRDARYLAQLTGVDNQKAFVVAVEPAERLAHIGKQTTLGLNVIWIDDMLPELINVKALQHKYHLVLLSAVWMHLEPIQRNQALAALSALMEDNGLIVITLRHGECNDERLMYPVYVDEIVRLAPLYDLQMVKITDRDEDTLGRSGVCWQTMALRKTFSEDNGQGRNL